MVDLSGTCLGEIVAARRRQSRRHERARPRNPEARRRGQARKARFCRRPLGRAAAGYRGTEARLAFAGIMPEEFRRDAIAQSYEAAGASALSVLTEERYFLGSLVDLETVRAAVRLPVLRKDFILEDYQIYESVAAGADALLLIVAALSDEDLRSFLELCRELRIAALVEVHDQIELQRAVQAGAAIIGVNNRDLKTLEVDLATSFRLRPGIPADCIAVSESGIKTWEDLYRIAEAGYHAVLIGERFMTAADPGLALRQLLDGLRSHIPFSGEM